MTLEQLGLTPNQRAEISMLDPALVAAWLEAVDRAGTLRSPAGWFLASVRTGKLPHELAEPRDAQHLRNAERWIRNVGSCFDPQDEHLVAAALFDAHGFVRDADEATKTRLLGLWRASLGGGATETPSSLGVEEAAASTEAASTAAVPHIPQELPVAFVGGGEQNADDDIPF